MQFCFMFSLSFRNVLWWQAMLSPGVRASPERLFSDWLQEASREQWSIQKQPEASVLLTQQQWHIGEGESCCLPKGGGTTSPICPGNTAIIPILSGYEHVCVKDYFRERGERKREWKKERVWELGYGERERERSREMWLNLILYSSTLSASIRRL